MKTTLNPRKTFLHTSIKIKVTADREIVSADFLEDIHEIKLKDTGGRVYKYFKEDLIEGRDRFLVYVFETGEDFYKFDVIIKTDNMDEFIMHAGRLTCYVVDEDIEEQTVFTVV